LQRVSFVKHRQNKSNAQRFVHSIRNYRLLSSLGYKDALCYQVWNGTSTIYEDHFAAGFTKIKA